MRKRILDAVRAIAPCDALERAHADDVAAWISSGVEIFRVKKPDTPPKHLVSYFAPIDLTRRQILLVDHRKAELWLPPGGHVEPGEDPAETVSRECREELAVDARFVSRDPLFVTVTQTAGAPPVHTDVSLWYVLALDRETPLVFDEQEFHGVRWFSFDDVPLARSDPHMGRFLRKLAAV